MIKDSGFDAYEVIVYSKALKRWVKVAVVHYKKEDGTIKIEKIYFSTDTKIKGVDLLIYYKIRFQIEFLHRDAKQFTGLEQCQRPFPCKFKRRNRFFSIAP